ncbi:MAG: hypothetical protein J5586_02315 [Clostridia bacterium]|nr:hypothetical protein [Clostridia bacterium]
MKECYYVCSEDAPGAEEFSLNGSKGKSSIWLTKRECPEELFSDICSDVKDWIIEEIYTEDDDHGDAFRYFDRNEITHPVSAENAIVKDGRFIGAVFRNRARGSLMPVLIGDDYFSGSTERLSETHELVKQTRARLVRRAD